MGRIPSRVLQHSFLLQFLTCYVLDVLLLHLGLLQSVFVCQEFHKLELDQLVSK